MIYFDNAATTYPKPPKTVKIIKDCIIHAGGNPGRSSHLLSMRAADIIYSCREKICILLGYDKPENVIFTPNATYALNLAIKTKVREGSHILISDMEHNSVLRPVRCLSRDKNITYDVFPTDGDIEKNICEKITEKTDILVCNHVSNVCGRKQDLKKIGELCKRKGIYFIADLSQSIGHFPINFNDICADAVCAPGHKGLFGIQGSGFVLLRNSDGLREFIEGGSGSNSKDTLMPMQLPDRYEAGTLFTPAIAALSYGIDYINKIGYSEIEERENRILKRIYDILSDTLDCDIYAPKDLTGSVLSFNIKGFDQNDVASYLCEKNVYCRGGYHCSPLAHKAIGTFDTGAVRLSISLFNKMSEAEKLFQIIKESPFSK
ncbi:MAG: aminotransferase class V-fold PLP-dependent enzyme [Eubacteriales bacterium]|nr:aminotransferase class V-fold PLP-dependent enzyme [Eubacteriales bacterium]